MGTGVLLMLAAAAVCSAQALRIIVDENVDPIGRIDPASCPSGSHYCDNRCLRDAFICDGNVDCKDASDEKNCTKCTPDALMCDGKCVSDVLRCDSTKDCVDGADEAGCGAIDDTKLTLFHGNVKRHDSAICDGQYQVRSGADEKNCGEENCDRGSIFCFRTDTRQHSCLAKAHLCDGLVMCLHGEDERNCTFEVEHVNIPRALPPRKGTGPLFVYDEARSTRYLVRETCPAGTRACSDRCIKEEYWCDGYEDCGLEDERDCAAKCSPLAFRCDVDKCIRDVYRCDGTADCADGTDEADCGEIPATDLFVCRRNVTRRNETKCDGRDDCLGGRDEDCEPKQCQNGAYWCRIASVGMSRCHRPSTKCDGYTLCSSGLDENNCTFEVERVTLGRITATTTTAAPLGVRPDECASGSRWCSEHRQGRCLRDEFWCDGKVDCDDDADEKDCHQCGPRGFSCNDGSTCTPIQYRCDGTADCHLTAHDEQDCPTEPSGPKFTCDDGDTNRYKSVGCDGLVDCGDGRDERRCKRCRPGSLFCDGACLWASRVCDGKDDCLDGKDEANCTAPGALAFPPKP